LRLFFKEQQGDTEKQGAGQQGEKGGKQDSEKGNLDGEKVKPDDEKDKQKAKDFFRKRIEYSREIKGLNETRNKKVEKRKPLSQRKRKNLQRGYGRWIHHLGKMLMWPKG